MTDEYRLTDYKLIQAIKTFSTQREINHCNLSFSVSPFDIYVNCPECETKMKVRSLSCGTELEDFFDAVFEWMVQPQAKEQFEKRQKEIIEDLNK